jgi:hypothetical protein
MVLTSRQKWWRRRANRWDNTPILAAPDAVASLSLFTSAAADVHASKTSGLIKCLDRKLARSVRWSFTTLQNET